MTASLKGLIAVAAVLALYMLLISPLSEKRVEIKESLFVEHSSLVKHERFIKSTKNAAENLEKALGNLKTLERYIIVEKDASLAFARMQTKVQDIATTSGLRISSIKPLSPVEFSDGYKGLPLYVDCTGDAESLSKFLNYLDSTWEMISIDKLYISASPRDELRIKVQLTGLMKS